MFFNSDVTPEEEDEIINRIAQEIHKQGFDVPAVFMIQSVRPLSYFGAQMGRLFVTPFLPIFDESLGIKAEKFLEIFENRGNIDKLINAVEELSRLEEEQKKAEKSKTPEKSPNKGWRRFLPF